MKLFYVFLLATLLSACATSMPVQKQALESKSLIIVPTGRTTYELNSQMVAFMLGSQLTVSTFLVDMNKAAAEIEIVLADDSLMNIMSKQAQQYLKVYTGNEVPIFKQHTLKDTLFKDYYKPDSRVDISSINGINQDLVIEVSVPFIFIQKGAIASCASELVSVRVIATKTGAILGRANEGNVSACNGIAVSNKDDPKAFLAEIKNKLEILTEKNIKSALEKIFPTK
jgi:hypothetical protein